MFDLTQDQYDKLKEAFAYLNALTITGVDNFALAGNAGVRLRHVIEEVSKQEIIIDNTKKEVK